MIIHHNCVTLLLKATETTRSKDHAEYEPSTKNGKVTVSLLLFYEYGYRSVFDGRVQYY